MDHDAPDQVRIVSSCRNLGKKGMFRFRETRNIATQPLISKLTFALIRVSNQPLVALQ